MSRTYRIATRQSKLAQIQARMVGDALVAADPGTKYELVFITTTGDKFMGDLAQVGGKGAFVKEVEDALLAKKADIAVHSLKDLPEPLPEGLTLVGCLPREDVRDTVICRPGESLVSLKEGATVGTSSMRRGAQIKAMFPHLKVKHFRGNVQTRLAKLDAGEVDATLLAKCGLERLKITERISEVLEPDVMCPAVGQGAIGFECRTDDTPLMKTLERMNDEKSFTCVKVERDLLLGLEGNCHTPIGGLCTYVGEDDLELSAVVLSIDGQSILRSSLRLPATQAADLGKQVAADLLAQGARAIIDATKSA